MSKFKELRIEAEVIQYYGILVSHYGSLLNAQHSLLTGYLSAHSFFVAATALMMTQITSAEGPIVLAWAVTFMALLGIFMAFQMRLAWDRSRAEVGLIMKFIEEYEASLPPPWRPFDTWRRLKEDPNSALAIGNSQAPFKTHWGFKFIENVFGKRAGSLPYALGGLYLIIAVLAWVVLARNISPCS